MYRLPLAATLVLLGSIFGYKLWPKIKALTPKNLELLCVGTLFLATVAVYYQLILGGIPLSWDHNVHLIKIIEFKQILQRGSIFGWTDMEFAGYPHNLQYPFLGY